MTQGNVVAKPFVWLDLCSGLGGASQPALDRGWKVIRVDIDPRFKPDMVADVRNLPLKGFHVDVLWASPPCQEFSKWGMRHFYPDPPLPDVSIAVSLLRHIQRLAPRYWVIENVYASRRWLTPLFGPVRALPAGHTLWGRLPGLIPLTPPHKQAPSRHFGTTLEQYEKRKRYFVNRLKSPCWTGHNGLSAAEAARIPYEIGEAICRAVEQRNA